MRGCRAKAIRKEHQKAIKSLGVDFRYYKMVTGQIFNRYRMAYQKLKDLRS